MWGSIRRFFVTALLAMAIPLAAWAGVNVNTASGKELESLPGIGPSKAAAIIQYRTDNGPFHTVDELSKVPGIGAKTVEALRAEAEVGDGTTVTKGAPSTGASSTGASSKAASGAAVNVNSAGLSELQSLPGIGPSKAQAILDDRTAKGPFSSCEELSRVTGVGPKTVETLKPMCKTSD